MRARGWLVACVALAGCGGGGGEGTLPPSPPGVQVLATTPIAVGTQFSVDVQVTGCAKLSSVSLTDQQSGLQLATTDNPGPRTTFTFQRNQIPYKQDGIAAKLALVATAKCSNGASGQSDGVSQVFMPADTAFPGAFPFSNLSLDPDGSGLVTCANGTIVDLDTSGVQRASASGLLFNCTAAGRAIHDGSFVYWLEPGTIAVRLDSQLRLAGGPYRMNPGQMLLPSDPSAPAVIFDASNGPAFVIDRASGAVISNPGLTGGILDGAAGLGSAGLFVPEEADDTSGTKVNLIVERFDPQSGASIATNTIADVPVDAIGAARVPQLNVSADGTQAYFISGASQNELWGCPSDSDCLSSPTALHVVLPGGPYVAAQPLGQTMIVLGADTVLFTTLAGAPIGSPAHPGGGVGVLGVYPGVGNQFYMLDGDVAGNLLELVMFSSPGVEVARFGAAGTPFGADLDQNGVPYLLFSGQLSRLLTPDQYLAARQ